MGELPLGLRESLAGRYAIERELGRGGVAAVYLARDLRHDRPVTLKVLHSQLAARLDPTLDPLRKLPRFQKLVEATG